MFWKENCEVFVKKCLFNMCRIEKQLSALGMDMTEFQKIIWMIFALKLSVITKK